MKLLTTKLHAIKIYCGETGERPARPRRPSRNQRLRNVAKPLSMESRMEQQRQREIAVLQQTTAAEQPVAAPPPPPEPATIAQQQAEVEEVERGAQQLEVVSSEESEGVTVVDAEVDDEPQTLEDRMRQEIERKARALMEIMQAGAAVEEAIARHAAEIDDTMLELLRRRMEASRSIERNGAVLEGLEALRRRLAAELERKTAPPALRLLDSLLSMLDSEEEVKESQGAGTGGGMGWRSGQEEEKAARERLRIAFGAAPLGGDVLSVAAQLAAGGQAFVDEVAGDTVDPDEFLTETTALLDRAMEQQRQLEEALAGAAEGSPERAQLQQVVAGRARSIQLVESVLALTREVQREMLKQRIAEL